MEEGREKDDGEREGGRKEYECREREKEREREGERKRRMCIIMIMIHSKYCYIHVHWVVGQITKCTCLSQFSLCSCFCYPVVVLIE